MPLQAAIFDFNGVLVDDEKVHFQLIRDVLSSRGIPLTEEEYFGKYFVYDDAGVFRTLHRDRRLDLPDTTLRSLCEAKAALYESVPSDQFVYFPHGEALARDAARHVPVGIASGARGAEIRRHLGLRGMEKTFGAVVSIDDVREGKPDPEVYLEAARRLGVAPDRCIAFEDSPGGIAAAHAARMKVVGVTHSVPAARLPADLVVDSFEGLSWHALAERFK